MSASLISHLTNIHKIKAVKLPANKTFYHQDYKCVFVFIKRMKENPRWVQMTPSIYLHEVHRSSFGVWLESRRRQIPHTPHTPEGRKHTDIYVYIYICIDACTYNQTNKSQGFPWLEFWINNICEHTFGIYLKTRFKKQIESKSGFGLRLSLLRLVKEAVTLHHHVVLTGTLSISLTSHCFHGFLLVMWHLVSMTSMVSL